jgi:hypothetical protein
VQSGIPLAVSQVTNFNAFAGFGTQRPNLVGDPRSGAPRNTDQFFNVSAFAVTPQFRVGSASRNPVRGPDYRNFDFSMIKKTPVHEQMNIEFRAEIFNLHNTPPWCAKCSVGKRGIWIDNVGRRSSGHPVCAEIQFLT